jgi:hypothetical protein
MLFGSEEMQKRRDRKGVHAKIAELLRRINFILRPLRVFLWYFSAVMDFETR